MSKSNKVLSSIIGGGIVSFHAIFAKAFNSVSTGLMLSQALFYQEGARFKKLVEIDNEKWFAKTSDEWFDDTGITEEAQRTAREKLKSAGIMHEIRAGAPATMHYRIDTNSLVAVISRYLETGKSIAVDNRNKKREITRTESGKFRQLKAVNSGNSYIESLESLENNERNNTVAPSSLLVTTVELVEVEADEKSAVEEKNEVKNRSVAPLPPTPLPAEPTQPAAKPKRKGKNASEPFTYRDMAKYMEIPVQVFFSEIIRNEAWPKWIEYKKNKKKFEYDAADSAAAVVRKLYSISGGDPLKASEIILQSRSSGWAGLFPLESQQPQRQPYQNQQQPRQRSEVDGLVFSR